jgi:hypothetical protein
VSLAGFFSFTIVANYGQEPFNEVGGTSQPVLEPSLARVLLMLVGLVPAVLIMELWPTVATTTLPRFAVNLGFALSMILAGFTAVAMLRLQYVLPRVPDFSQVLSGGGTEYALLTGLSPTPLLVFLVWVNRLFDAASVLAVGLLIVTTVMTLIAVIVLAVNGTELVEAFRRGGTRYVQSRWIHGVTFVLGAILGWATVLTGIATLRELPWILSAAQGAANPLFLTLAATVVATLLLSSYVVRGIFAQVCGLWVSLTRLIRAGIRADRAPAIVDKAVSAPVLVVPDNDALATALFVGPLT